VLRHIYKNALRPDDYNARNASQSQSTLQALTSSSNAAAAGQRKPLGDKGVIGGGKEKHGMGGEGLGSPP